MNITPKVGWTAHRLERLQTLWKEGWSASQIASELGGVSRSAICGKIARLGLSSESRKAASKPMRLVRKPNQKLSVVPATQPLQAVFVEPDSRPLPPQPLLKDAGLNARAWDTRLKRECAWPIEGPNGQLLACCDPSDATYCPAHARIAYQPRDPRRQGKSYERSIARLAHG